MREAPRLTQDAVMDAHLANIVKRGRRSKVFDVFWSDDIFEFRIFPKFFCNALDNNLGTFNMLE